MPKKIGSRYLAGFVIKSMDSRNKWGDSDDDYIVKRIWIKAEKNSINEWELAAFHEVETFWLVGGEDRGAIHGDHGGEVYRVPYPYDTKLRKTLIRSFIEHPKFFDA